jgi:hypothetical protein
MTDTEQRCTICGGLMHEHGTHPYTSPQPEASAEPCDHEFMCPNCVTPWKCNGPHRGEVCVRCGVSAESMREPTLGQASALRKRIEELRTYTEHRPDCNTWRSEYEDGCAPCDCGLAALLGGQAIPLMPAEPILAERLLRVVEHPLFSDLCRTGGGCWWVGRNSDDGNKTGCLSTSLQECVVWAEDQIRAGKEGGDEQ